MVGDIRKRKTNWTEHWMKKFGEFLSTHHSVHVANVYPPNRLFGWTYFGPYWVLHPRIYTRATEWLSLASTWPIEDGVFPQQFFTKGVKNCSQDMRKPMSSCLQIALVYLQPVHRSSLLNCAAQPKIAKKQSPLFLEFRVFQSHWCWYD